MTAFSNAKNPYKKLQSTYRKKETRLNERNEKKNSENMLKETEVHELPEKEFKITIKGAQ